MPMGRGDVRVGSTERALAGAAVVTHAGTAVPVGHVDVRMGSAAVAANGGAVTASFGLMLRYLNSDPT